MKCVSFWLCGRRPVEPPAPSSPPQPQAPPCPHGPPHPPSPPPNALTPSPQCAVPICHACTPSSRPSPPSPASLLPQLTGCCCLPPPARWLLHTTSGLHARYPRTYTLPPCWPLPPPASRSRSPQNRTSDSPFNLTRARRVTMTRKGGRRGHMDSCDTRPTAGHVDMRWALAKHDTCGDVVRSARKRKSENDTCTAASADVAKAPPQQLPHVPGRSPAATAGTTEATPLR